MTIAIWAQNSMADVINVFGPTVNAGVYTSATCPTGYVLVSCWVRRAGEITASTDEFVGRTDFISCFNYAGMNDFNSIARCAKVCN